MSNARDGNLFLPQPPPGCLCPDDLHLGGGLIVELVFDNALWGPDRGLLRVGRSGVHDVAVGNNGRLRLSSQRFELLGGQ